MQHTKSAGAFLFSGRWKQTVQALPETGMGYTVVNITLADGRIFAQSVINSGHLSRIRGIEDVPFVENDIAAIVPTHEKWNWEER